MIQSLCAHARRGSARAFAALCRRCQSGPVPSRTAFISALPGLLPYQPVRGLLCELDSALSPAPVRQAAAQARRLLRETSDCERAEATYRAGQRVLVAAFARDEGERVQKQRPPLPLYRPVYLAAAERVADAFYEYRRTWADGCLFTPCPQHVDEFLTACAPRQALCSQRPDLVPSLLGLHMTWLGRRGLLLGAAARGLARRCLRAGRSAPQALPGLRDFLRRHHLDPVDLRSLDKGRALFEMDLDEEFSPIFDL